MAFSKLQIRPNKTNNCGVDSGLGEAEFDTESQADEDDWYYKSFNCYGMLVMYGAINPVVNMQLCGPFDLCVLGQYKNRNILSNLVLPNLLVNKGNHVPSTTNDLHIRAGIYIDRPTFEIVPLYGEGKVLASQGGVEGVGVYDICPEDSDQIKDLGVLKFPMERPHICTSGKYLVATTEWSFMLVDHVEEEVVFRNTRPKPSPTMPFHISENALCFGHTKTGTMELYDPRQKHIFETIEVEEKADLWTFGSQTYSAVSNNTFVSTSKVCLASNDGVIQIYDLRKCSVPLVDIELDLNPMFPELMKISLCPFNEERVAISGFDECIHVYDLNGTSAKEVFVHDGHSHTEGCETSTFTSGHFWFPLGGPSLIISSALNSSINCWEFIANS